MFEHKSKKGFTIVELVIVLAVIAILAAVLIPTFSKMLKTAENSAYEQERRNQELQDTIDKITNNGYMTWEEFEAKFAEVLANAGNQPDADAIKAAVLEALANAEFTSTGLSEEQIKKIIEKSLEGLLTDAQVRAIVDAALNNLDIVTEAQIRNMINDIKKDLPSGVTESQMKAAIKEAIKGLKSGLNESDIEAAIANAVNDLNKDQLTADDVKAIVDAALDELSIPDTGLTESQVAAIVNNAIKQMPKVGITEEQMKDAIETALANVKPGLNQQDVEDAIAAALENFKPETMTEDQIRDLIEDVVESLTPSDEPAGNAINNFADLQAAFENGGTYYLASDVTVTSPIKTFKNLTIDLHGQRLIVSVASGSLFSGTIIAIEGESSENRPCMTFNDSVGGGSVINNSTIANDAVFGLFHDCDIVINGGTFLSNEDGLFGGVGGSTTPTFTINGGSVYGYIEVLQGYTIILNTEMTLRYKNEFLDLEFLDTHVVAGAGYTVTKTSSGGFDNYTCTANS